MPMFVTDERVPIYEFDPAATISDREPNIIYIRARMDVATRNAVQGAIVTLGRDGKTTEMDLGASLTALLEHNIVGWAGPDFDTVPCTRENIRRLDPSEPLVERVTEAIGERNQRRATDPKSFTSAGDPSSVAPAKVLRGRGTPT